MQPPARTCTLAAALALVGVLNPVAGFAVPVNGARPVRVPLAQEEAKLIAPDGGANDEFGRSVDIYRDVAVIGAPGFLNGSPGSAYVFVRVGGIWTEQQELTASDGAADAIFGYSVAVIQDLAIVTAPFSDTAAGTDAGAAYVFVRSGGVWTEQQKLTASDAAAGDFFGGSVAIHRDTAVIGAYGDDTVAGRDAGSAYVFVHAGDVWTEQQKLTASDGAPVDGFGASTAVWEDDAVVGAYTDDTAAGVNAGSAYVYVRSGGVWTEQQKLTASDGANADFFAESVSVGQDTIVAGAERHKAAAGRESGAAYVFVRSGVVWSEQQELTPSDAHRGDFFGKSVALVESQMVVGAYRANAASIDAGAAYVFARSGGVWTEQQKLTASDGRREDFFGTRVALSLTTAVVGAFRDDTAGGVDAGSAYLFGL
jgi:hypothetical protein